MKYELKEESEFVKLSRKLEPDERNALLQKIQKINIIDENDTHKDKNEKSDKKLLYFLSNIYNKSDFLTRLFIWLESFFSGKKREEIILNKLLADVRKDLSTNYSDLINFKTNSFTKKFSETIVVLSDLCNELSVSFNYFFQDPIYYYSFLSHLLEKKFDDDLVKILQSLKPETFSSKTDHIEKELFFNEKDKRLKIFTQKISLHTYTDIEDFFNKFEYIILIVFFDYSTILTNYLNNQFSVESSTSEISYFNIDSILERLYILLETVTFDYETIKYVEEMVAFSEKFIKESTPVEIKFSENDINSLKYLFTILNKIKAEIPFKKIFQYYKKDLLYTPQKIDFNSDFISIYKEFKRKIINKEWTDYFNSLNEINLKKTLQQIFKDYNFDTLENFTPDFKILIDSKATVKLKNVKKMNLLVKFLDEKYSKDITRILNRVLINGNFTKDSYRSNLSNLYYMLYNYNEKLRNFDSSFENEQELGKKISTYTKAIFAEQESSKSFQLIIKEINSKSDKLCEDAYLALWNLNIFLNNIISNLITSNVILLNLNDIKITGYLDLKSAILKIKEVLDIFFKVYNNLPD